MSANSQPPAGTRFYFATAPQFGVQEQAAASPRAPMSYWLLIVFLVLLYANLPFLVPAVEVARPAAVVGGLALVMLLVEVMTGSRTLEMAWPEGCLLVMFLGAAAMSCLTALWPGHATEALSDLIKMTLAYFFIVNCATNVKRLRGVIWTLVICGLMPAIGTIHNYAIGSLEEGRARWVGIFSNPNEVAYSLVILIPIALALAAEVGWFSRLALLGIVLVDVVAIFVTFSRGGYLGLAVAVGLFAWRKRNIWIQGAMVLVVIAGMSLGGKYWSRGEDFSNLNGDVSFQQRIATSQAGVAMFADHPLLGVGLGCSVIAWPLYAPKDLYSRGALVTHNTFIQPLAETGLIGFVPFVLLIGICMYHTRKRALNSTQPRMAGLSAGLEAALWGFAVCGMSGGYVLTWFPYILLGMASAAKRVRGDQ